MKIPQRLLLPLLILSASLLAPVVQAQIGIQTLPYTIKKPGRYSLSASLNYKGIGAAITILADDVSLDLRGRSISAIPANSLANETAGIYSNSRKNITIRNGVLKNFFRGVYLEGTNETGGHLVEDIEVRDSTFLGIQVKGAGSVIRRNSINSVGAGGGATSYLLYRYGIDVTGDSIHVQENRIFDVFPNSTTLNNTAYGIVVRGYSGSVIERNRIINTPASRMPNQFGVGIIFQDCSNCAAIANIITMHPICFALNGQNTHTGNLYRDNTFIGNTSNAVINLSGAPVTNGGGNSP
jgi:hypothetical protein